MVQKKLAFLLFITLSFNSLSKDIYSISLFDLEKLNTISPNNCLVQNLLLNFSKKEAVQNIFETCSICEKSTQHIYYCHYSSYLSYLNTKEYSKASRILEAIKNDQRLSSISGYDVLIKETNQLSSKLAVINSIQRGKGNKLFLENGFLKIKLGERKWLFDTGATFGSGSKELCLTKKGDADVSDVFGKTLKKEYCRIDVGIMKNYPVSIKEGGNILGLMYILGYDKFETIPKPEGSLLKVPFKLNGRVLIASGSVSFRNRDFTNINMCIDTGSEKTLFLPKLYRKARKTIENIEASRIEASGIHGNTKTLGKLIESAKINMVGNEFTLNYVPILFKQSTLVECDVLLGMDLLKNIASIDFTDMEINLVLSTK